MLVHDELKCGECGGATFTLTNVRPPDSHRAGGGGSLPRGTAPESVSAVVGFITVTCTTCKRESNIYPAATLAIGVGGSLCGGWRS